jgi:hypothetical protein
LRWIRRPFESEVVPCGAEPGPIHYRLFKEVGLHHTGEFADSRIHDSKAPLWRAAKTGKAGRIAFFLGELWSSLRNRNCVHRQFLWFAMELQREAIRQQLLDHHF